VIAVRLAADRLSRGRIGRLLGLLNGSLGGTRTVAVPIEV
jgi:hypothetical protein